MNPLRTQCRPAAAGPATAGLLWVGLLAGTLSLALACAGTSVHRQTFIALDTPHFSIISSLSTAETRALAHDLETFRTIASVVTGVEFQRPTTPLQVVAFDDRTFERPFEKRGERSYFHQSALEPMIVLRHGEAFRGDIEHQLLHDLVHFWVWSQGAPPQAPWRDEGFADLLSTARPEGSRLDVGDIRKDYLDQLGDQVWISLDSVLSQPSLVRWGSDRRNQFRAQSWLFTHFVTFRLDSSDALAQGQPVLSRPALRASRFEAAVRDGVTVGGAFERAYGEPLRAVQKDLTRYAQSKEFSIATAGVPGERRYRPGQPTPVPSHEAWARLGRLLLEIGNWEEAEEYFERVRESRESRAEEGRVQGGLALAHAEEQEFEHALSHLERGLALVPDDAIVQLDAGRFHMVWARAVRDTPAYADHLGQARQYLRRSSELDPDQAATWLALGRLELEVGKDPRAATDALERAHVLAPASLDVQLDLARAYLEVGRGRDARTLAGSIASRSHDTSQIRAATALYEGRLAPEDGADVRQSAGR